MSNQKKVKKKDLKKKRSKKLEQKKTGNYLFSHTLSSAYKCLTTLFGMGRGVST